MLPPEQIPAIPEELDILPLFGTVVYPRAVVPLAVGQPAAVRLLDTPTGGARLVGLVTLRAEERRPEPVQPADCFSIGTAALVHRLLRLPDGTLRVAIQGLERVELVTFSQTQPGLRATVRSLVEPDEPPDQRTTSLMRSLVTYTQQLARTIPNFNEEMLEQICNEADPHRLAYLVATATLLRRTVAERQQILELPDTHTRLEQLNALLAVDLQMLRSRRVTPLVPPAEAQTPLPEPPDVMRGRTSPAVPVTSTSKSVVPPEPDTPTRPGSIRYLRWTPTGGECVTLEAVQMHGGRTLLLTGQRDDRTLDSAQVALSWVRSAAKTLGLAPDFYDQIDLHIHIPPGSAPDDTRAVGVAIATTLVSLLTGRCAGTGVALTGEITLHGHIRPTGHIREKVLAAYHAGLHTCILPRQNMADLNALPRDVRAALTCIFVENMHEVLTAALDNPDMP
jgi:ATP-dependent Lon protease